MDVVQLAQTVDLLNKVGKNTDASGTTTLFSRLQQIVDYVDTLETKLGLNSDASGTTTVFARLAQIAAYVDQVEGFTDTLETLLGTVNTNVNTINTNVSANGTKIGANTDASGTSTLFALLKKLDAAIANVGVLSIGASNTVQESYLPVQTLSTAGVNSPQLVAKFVPKGIGDLVVEFDIKAGGGGNILLGAWGGNNTSDNVVSASSFDYSLPLGTVVGGLPSNGFPLMTVSSVTTFQTLQAKIRIYRKMPLYIYLYSGSGVAGGQVQNIKLKYDVVG